MSTHTCVTARARGLQWGPGFARVHELRPAAAGSAAGPGGARSTRVAAGARTGTRVRAAAARGEGPGPGMGGKRLPGPLGNQRGPQSGGEAGAAAAPGRGEREELARSRGH